MLTNAYFLAKIRFDTAQKEPAKNLQKFANFANQAGDLVHKSFQALRFGLRVARQGLRG